MPAAVSRSSGGAPAVEAASGYLASEGHYLSVAGRILAALRGDVSVVLVTGDPTADPQLLSQALRKLAGSRHRVIGISCGPELTGEDVSRAGSVVATLPAGGGTVTMSDTADTDAPLFVLDEAERLSDQQLGEIRTAMQHGAKQNAAGVLLARRGFLARLEQPALQFLREPLVLQLRFDEIGEDEGIEFLRHQLAVRHSQDETSRGRPIFFRSLAVLAVLLAIGVGASLALHYVRVPDVNAPDEQSVPPVGNPQTGNPQTGNPQIGNPQTGNSPAENPSPSVAPLQPAPGAAPSAAAVPSIPVPPKPLAAPAVPACSTAARANAPAECICSNPGCAAPRNNAASASSTGAISGGPAPFCHGDRRPGNARRRVPQRRGHRVGAVVLRTRRRRGRQRCGASAGCDVRSQFSRPCRCPRQPGRPRSGRLLVSSSPRPRRCRRRGTPQKPATTAALNCLVQGVAGWRTRRGSISRRTG